MIIKNHFTVNDSFYINIFKDINVIFQDVISSVAFGIDSNCKFYRIN